MAGVAGHLLSQLCPQLGHWSSEAPRGPHSLLAWQPLLGVPFPHTQHPQVQVLLTCTGEESVVSSQRPSGSSERLQRSF